MSRIKPNPFSVGGPVSFGLFEGRAGEIFSAFDRISKREHLAVNGSPGIGKSSFLSFLAAPRAWQRFGIDSKPYVVVLVNGTSIQPFTPTGFWHVVLTALLDKLTAGDPLRTEVERVLRQPVIGTQDFSQLLKQIGGSGRSLVLLVDDYDFALDTNKAYSAEDRLGFLYAVRNLCVDARGQYLSMIVTTPRRLDEMGPEVENERSPWYNQYLYLPLQPFSEDDARSLWIHMPIDLQLTEAHRVAVQEIAGGHPALLHQACHLLYEKLAVGGLSQFDLDAFQRDFVRRTEGYFERAWKTATEVEKVLLDLIALSRLKTRLPERGYDLGDLGIVFSQRDRELRDLEERGLLRRVTVEGKPGYTIASAVMEWWLIQQLETGKAPREIQERELLVFGVTKEQVAKIGTVLKQVWQHKDAITKLVEWTGQLAGAFAKGFGGAAT